MGYSVEYQTTYKFDCDAACCKRCYSSTDEADTGGFVHVRVTQIDANENALANSEIRTLCPGHAEQLGALLAWGLK